MYWEFFADVTADSHYFDKFLLVFWLFLFKIEFNQKSVSYKMLEIHLFTIKVNLGPGILNIGLKIKVFMITT